jgi:NADP oxidoreductase coenzyme F420-dependent
VVMAFSPTLESSRIMSSISIIGVGGMARALAERALAGGNVVEVIGRDAAKAKDLAAALGGGATAGTFGATPAGDIVILAVSHAGGVPVVAQYADALAGKVVVEALLLFLWVRFGGAAQGAGPLLPGQGRLPASLPRGRCAPPLTCEPLRPLGQSVRTGRGPARQGVRSAPEPPPGGWPPVKIVE